MSLRLAAEQQREGGSPALRDTLIQLALDEGHSVADVADALGLTAQAVYRAREAQGPGSQRGLSQRADTRAIADVLERFSDPRGFEQLVCALIGDIEPAAIPLGGPGDRGRDAAVPDSTTIVTVSLARQWQRKVRADLARIAAEGFRPGRVFAVTNRRTARRSVEKLAAEASAGGVELHVLDQSWLVAKLSEPRHLHLRGDWLGLPSPRSKSFFTAEEYRGLLDGRPHLAGMSAAFVGRERELGRAAELLDSEGVVLLRGRGGMGKTRLALRLAEADKGDWRFIDADMRFEPESIAELAPSPRLVVVIDNAHRRERLGELVVALEGLRRRPRVVLIARPEFEARLEGELARTWLGPIGEARTVDVGPLRWETMAAILKAPPLRIESGTQRGELVRLAEGNPQIAVIAARVAKERKSVVGLSGDELLQRYIAYLISSAIPAGSETGRLRELLALLAALDGIETGDEELLAEVGEALRLSIRTVEEGLEQLAECGLAVSERGRYRIKPDLLAEHALFALTLSGNWQPALDYQAVLDRFGPSRLARLVKAVSALPAGLFDGDDEAASRLAGLERCVARVVETGSAGDAAELVRDLCRPRPRLAGQLALELLERFRRAGEQQPPRVIEKLCEGAMQIADFPRSWRLLLRLAAECAGSPQLSEKIGTAMGETYQRLPEGDASSGVVLAWVQDSLAGETERFWSRRREGAASAVALALRPMLTLSFETHRVSPDNPMALEIGGRFLPASDYTERVVATGGRLAAEIFAELSAAEQLKLLETAGWATHAAAGFPMSAGRASLDVRQMLDEALVELDLVLAARLEQLEMPVRADAYGYLLKRARYRRKLDGELEQEGPARRAAAKQSVPVPRPSRELEEYLFLMHNKQLGPPDPDRGTIREEHDRMIARAGELAAALAGDPDWRQRLDRWSAWWDSRRALESEPRLGPEPAMVFDGLARGDAERGAAVLDHLIATGSDLRAVTAVAMGWVIRAGLEESWRPWLEADPETRATLAGALASCEEELGADAIRQLAFDEDASVRRAAQSALAFSISPESWRFDLALEAAAADPEIEAIGRLLHLADQRAEEAGDGEHQLGERHRPLLREAILGTAASPRLEGYRLADSLQRASRDVPEIAMEWAWARLEQLDLMRDKRDELRLWDIDFLPDELEPLVSSAAGEGDLARAIRLFAELEDRSPALPDTAKLIGWLGAGDVAVTELIASLLEGERASRARSYLLEFSLPPDELDQRAETLADSLDEPARTLLELIEGQQPRSWSGSYVPHHEAALAHAERWIGSSSAALREAGREARDVFRRRIEREKVSEEIEDREFEYR